MALFGELANASTAPPHEYYVMSPEPLMGPISLMSLEPNNTITLGGYQVTLQQYETATVPETAFTSGTKFSGTGFFTLGSGENAADLLVPDDFAGTSFVVPHIQGSHRYFILSPNGTAQVTIRVGASTFNLAASAGVVNEFDAGTDNTVAGRITSDAPIVVTHVSYVSGAARDAYPVPPAATDLFGVRSQNTMLAALSDGTSVNVYSSSGASDVYYLNAGEQVAITTGVGTAQGQGHALHISANAAVAAVQYDDSDGTDATGFWAPGSFSRRHGIPINAQYLAIVCDQSAVTLTLYKGANPPEVQSCSGSASVPGKAYFGQNASGSHIQAGWYLISSSPVYLMYEAATTDDEHNLLGLTPNAGPTAPTLNTVTSPTYNNPQTISGTAGANQVIRLYVNGQLQSTASADGAGNYTFNAVLIDGSNTLYTTAVQGGNESDPSNAVTFDYINNIPRNQSGVTISGTAVWTPGSPATPYTVTTANLTVAAGGQLIIQPGTEVRFGSGRSLTVNGTLTVKGSAAAAVVFTSDLVSPTRGSWVGVVLNGTATNVSIEGATIEWAQRGVDLKAGAIAAIRGSTIRNFSDAGLYFTSSTAATLVSGNTVDNLNDQQTCFYLIGASPTIQRNVIRNCMYGVRMQGSASTPLVNDKNLVTSNTYGFYLGFAGAPQPVVTGNEIHGNSSRNFYTSSYGTGAQNVRVNASANWWGTTNASTIGNGITDLTDSYTSTTTPVVDYSNFLDGPNGQPIVGNYLNGPFSAASTTLVSGTTYDVLGTIFVGNGKSLTVPGGAVLRLHGADTRLVADGTVTIQGTANNPVVLTSGRPAPAPGDWRGILIRSGATPIVEHALIEWAYRGVELESGAVATIRYNTIRNFSPTGLYLTGTSLATLITGNLIDNLNDDGTCLYLDGASPSVQGNTIQNCQFGVRITGNASAPIINANNLITSNQYGLYLGLSSTSPQPILSGNQIFANSQWNVYTTSYASGAQNLRLNATGNWWGTTDPASIGNGIQDYGDNYASTTMPVVDFANFLDGPNGNPISGNYLTGPFTAASTTLVAGTTYDVIGTIFVGSSKSLSVSEGAVLRMHGTNTRLVVEGSLSLQGTAASPVTLTSGRGAPTRGDWRGVLIRSGSTALLEYAVIDWSYRGVELESGAAATIRYNTVRNFSDAGLYFTGTAASTVVTGNTIDNANDQQTCIYLTNASPTIQGNAIRNCQYGVRMVGNSTAPVVNANNIITSNSYGMYLGSSGSPQPIVNGNQIYGNGTLNVRTSSYGSGAQNIRINAKGNWWGTTAVSAIGDSIDDITDDYTSTTLPVVDFADFLDGPNGNEVPGNYLVGPFAATSTTLTAGTTYDVLGTLFVPSGRSLTIPGGTVLRFHEGDTRLVVDGALTLQGTSNNLVVLTSGRSTPAAGNWRGVLLRAPGSVVEYARIEWSNFGVYIDAATATVRNNTITNISQYGVYVNGAAASGSSIDSNLIENFEPATMSNGVYAYGVYLYDASPAITGNTLRGTYTGLYVERSSSPTVTNNIITGNNIGVRVYGANTHTPLPVATGNQIRANQSYNYSAGGFASGAQNVILNATGNWWGTDDPGIISDAIYDLSDAHPSTTVPVVNFSSYLDGPSGSAVSGNDLFGPLTATSTTLTAGTTYRVLSSLFVPAGRSLTIPAGTILEFYGAETRLVVDGTLSIQGTPEARVQLTAGLKNAGTGAWYGIEIRSTATNVVIDHALIQSTYRAISVVGAGAVISNSIIRIFSDAGVWMSGAAAGSQITGNFIDNTGYGGKGIYLANSSPLITGNRIVRTTHGIYLFGSSNPTVTGNAITNNTVGILLDGNGSNSASAVPNPVITGNDIFGNSYAQIEVYRYGASNPVVINATNNWWGTATPQVGVHIKFTSGSPASVLNASSPRTDPATGPVSGNVGLSEYFFSPNGDAVKDVTAISGTLNQAAGWTVSVRDNAYATVRTYSGTGTSISGTWDGRNGSGQLLPDGVYTVEAAVSTANGAAIVGVRLAVLDNTPPLASITDPVASQLITNVVSVPVRGDANDKNFANFTLAFGAGTAPTSWTSINNQQTTGVSAGVLGNWIVSSVNGSVGLANGAHTLRLTSSDSAGNVAVALVPVTLDLLAITAVSQSRQVMKPTVGEQLQVNFTLSAPATTYLRIYQEAGSGGALVKEMSEVYGTGGAKALTWDGRTTSGAFASAEGYNIVIFATDGTRIATYDPPRPSSSGSGSGTVDSSFNANKNDFWKMNYTMAHFGRIRMQVSGCTSLTHYPYNWVPYPPGTHPLIWDGRGPDGQLVSGTCDIYFDPPLQMKPASVIVRGTAPAITGPGLSPNIEVRGNPYRITHSYEHISNITFRLDQDAYVTVKLLPPGISDPASPQAIVVRNNQLHYALSAGVPADHIIEWKGYEDADTNNILVGEEGAYTFAIQATSAATGATALYRGALQLWQ